MIQIHGIYQIFIQIVYIMFGTKKTWSFISQFLSF